MRDDHGHPERERREGGREETECARCERQQEERGEELEFICIEWSLFVLKDRKSVEGERERENERHREREERRR